MKTIIQLLLPTLFVTVMLVSCKKDRKDDPQPNNPTTTITVPVSGYIVDVYGSPLSGVTVKVGNQTFTTDYSGTFYFQSATFSGQRYTITFEKQGYFTLQRSGQLVQGKPVVLNVGLISENDMTYAATKQFNSSQADSVVLPNNSVVSFPANAFVTANGTQYNGMVTVKACYLDPTWIKYPMFVFNGDLYAKDSTNNDVMLNPFAGLNVVIEDANGNKLQLDSANNKKAKIKIKIPPQLAANAPNNIEMWVYAPQQGAKQGKGSAVKTGDSYQGEVLHFTYWSFEESFDTKAYVEGYVKKNVSGNEIGIGGVPIVVANQLVFTDNSGFYKAIVPAGLAGLTISPKYSALQSHTITNALSDGQVYQYDFIINQGSSLVAIYGTVRSSNQQPLANALVQINYYNYTSYTNEILHTFTNSQGKYQIVVDGNATSYSIMAKYGSQYVSSYISGPLTQDTQKDLTMPATPGQNYLKAGGQIIFNITGNAQNATISGYFNQELSIYVHVSNTGMFNISGINVNPTINNTYNLPSDYSVEYGHQVISHRNLTSGTIKFTKFNTNGLVEGEFNGQDSLGVQVEGKFSVPYSTLLLRSKK
ncbi:MAG: carboxypeptidase-like regulatory domain-containing protein [Bacteroidales bacterium]|nr:carboxypeptidase-like regulatory domain-containing protein [Bacteroidales bacterium]